MGSNVTLKEIAQELGMSAMTVSRALNNKDNVDKNTKKRVVEKARSMGYTPNHVAKSLVSRKTFTIGVVIPEIYHAFFSEVISGIEEVTYKRNYQLFLTNSAEKVEREKKLSMHSSQSGLMEFSYHVQRHPMISASIKILLIQDYRLFSLIGVLKTSAQAV